MNAWRAWAKVGSLAALLAASSCFNVGDDDDAGAGGFTSTGGVASGGSIRSSSGGFVSSPSTGGQASSTGGVSGVAGSVSTGGASDCAVCDKSQACCFAIAAVENTDTDPCLTFAQTTCDSLAGPAQAAIVTACQRYLQKEGSRDLAACH